MIGSGKDLFFILPGVSGPPPAGQIGSKAFGLARLAELGLPVPPAFVLGTDLCRDYFARGEILPDRVRELLVQGLARLEEVARRHFGDARRPLLVSVRSGAPVSMPGMMQTILNIGLCDQTLGGLLRTTGNPRLVRDCYRRLIRDFCGVVHGTEARPFDALVEQRCAQEHLADPGDLDTASLAHIVQESLELATALTGEAFPQDPMNQLLAAVEAVFRSWQSEKARAYRRLNNIDETLGTAVTVQVMVFGNAGGQSGSGVGFTRDPATGENKLYVDFLFNAQGEDVVSGRRTIGDSEELPRRLPLVAAELTRFRSLLEKAFRDMQDFEFTVEEGRLYLLQTRDGKRSPWAALRMAVDMVGEGLVAPKEAVVRLAGLPLDRLERLRIAGGSVAPPLASAIPASQGVAVGPIAFDSARARDLEREGRAAILLREEIATADIEGFAAAAGILTVEGGRTSHAAVIARQLGKVCLVGCHALRLDPDRRRCAIGERIFHEGDELTLDGESGRVYAGALPVLRERPERELAELERWRRAEEFVPRLP